MVNGQFCVMRPLAFSYQLRTAAYPQAIALLPASTRSFFAIEQGARHLMNPGIGGGHSQLRALPECSERREGPRAHPAPLLFGYRRLAVVEHRDLEFYPAITYEGYEGKVTGQVHEGEQQARRMRLVPCGLWQFREYLFVTRSSTWPTIFTNMIIQLRYYRYKAGCARSRPPM